MAKSAIKNKDLAQDIARACKMPEDVARKTLNIILAALVRDLRANKILKIRDFGIFKLFVQKRCNDMHGGYTSQKKYKCRFVTKGKLSIVLKNKWWYGYAWRLAVKYARQIKEGDIKGAKKTKKNLRKKLIGKWSMANWLAERGRLPYRLWKRRTTDV